MGEIVQFNNTSPERQVVSLERLEKLWEEADAALHEYALFVIKLSGGPQEEFEEHTAAVRRIEKDLGDVKKNIHLAREQGGLQENVARDNVQFLARDINYMNRWLGKDTDDSVRPLFDQQTGS